MPRVSYKLTAGGWSVSSADDPKTELVELDTQLALDSPGDLGRIALYAPPAPKPSLLEQAVGAAVSAAGSALGLGGGGGAEEEAFSVEVRGQKVKLGDRISIELAVDDRSATVLTGEIVAIQSDFERTTLVGRTGMHRLASARLNQVYLNQSLGQIVRDLAGQAGVDVGDVAAGQTYPYLVVHESKSLLRTLRELAMRDGADLYFDPDDKLTIRKFDKTSADHTFYYGIDLLDLEVVNLQPTGDHVVVSGESPASSQGSDTWHWLAKDLGPFQAEVGQGARRLAISDGAVRTKDAAAGLATAKLGTLKDQSALGRLGVLGDPTVKVGDAIEIKQAPKPEQNGLFKVTAVRHLYSKRAGYVTRVDFSGQGGAAKAGSLLGQLAGELAGALGL